MRIRTHVSLFLAAVLVLGALAGCNRDPNVRKRKYVESGDRYFEKQQYREAAIQYSNAVQVDPRFAEAHYKLAQSYLKLKLGASAYTELSRTVELQPDNLMAQLDLGNLLLAGREFSQAYDRAQTVLAKDPNRAEAHALVANAFVGMGNLEGALKEMGVALGMAPDRASLHMNLAMIQTQAKQPAAAEASFKKALALDPRSVSTLVALGVFYQQQKRWSEAEEQIRRAVELDRTNPESWTALARLFVAQNRPEGAEQVLRDAKLALKDDPAGYRLLGDLYTSLGQWEKGLAEFASLHKEHPDDLRITKNYINLLILTGALDEASRLNDDILKKNDKDIDARIYRAQLFNLRGDPNQAVEILDAVLKTEPDNAFARHQRGLALFAVGDAARAESDWREAVRLDPNRVDSLRNLAQLAQQKGDQGELSSIADQIITARSASPEGYWLRASVAVVRGQIPQAEADLRKAQTLAPQRPESYSRLAALRVRQRKFSDAEQLYEQALGYDSGNTEALEGLIATYLVQKQVPKALERVDRQIAKAPNKAAFYILKAQVLIAQTNLGEAETALQKALELNRNSLEALQTLARLQLARGETDRAMASFQRYIEANPRDARAYVLLGTLEERRNNAARAEELYRKALQVQPENPLAANNLAYLLLVQGRDTDVALSLAQVARRGMPDSPVSADTLAWAYYQKGAYRSAVDLLEGAVKSSPDNLEYNFHLGMAYAKLGDKARARAFLEKALRLDTGQAWAGEIRKALDELAKG